ncbi:MAG: 6-bladed beta-propeller [Gemmatimonadota bacterium]
MRVPLAAVVLLLCDFNTASAQRPLAKPVIDKVGSATRVMNPGPTVWADTNGWKLVLERTIQPKDGEAGELAEVSDVALLANGSVVVFQSSPISAKLFDASGRFLRQIGREGDGPGEYRRAKLATRGDSVVLFAGAAGRVTILTTSGKAVREFLTDTHYDGPPISVDTRNRLRVTGGRRVTNAPPVQQWVYFDLLGHRLDSMLPPSAVEQKVWRVAAGGGIASYTIPLAPSTKYAFRQDGGILYGADNHYELVVTRTGADTALVFGRTGVKPWPVSPARRDSLWARFATRQEFNGVASKSDIPAVLPLWYEMTFDGNGNLWVSTPSAASRVERFDVFSPDGRYLGAVPATFGTFSRSSWVGDRVAFVDEDTDDLPRIRIFRIDRRGK